VLFKNTLAQSGGVFASYLASLILAPVMLSRLGLDAFGVWAVTGAFVTYARTLDLGVGRSLARFVALYHSSDDRRGVRECMGLGLIAVSLLSVVGAIAALLLAPLVSDLLNALTPGEMRIVLVSSVLLGMTYAYSQVLTALPIGMREMVPPNVANVILTVTNLVFSLVALAISTKLTTYAVANAAAGIVGMVPFLVVLSRVWEGSYLAIPRRERVREVIGYGIKGQVVWIADLINLETDKVVIATLLGVRVAGAYEIGARIASSLRSFGILTVSAMIPTATAEIVEHGREVIARFYRRYLKLTVGISFGLFTLGSATVPFVLVAWLGEIPGQADVIAVLLVVGYAFNVSTGVGSSLAMAEGKPGAVAAYSALTAGINLVLTVSLTPIFDLWGVLVATASAWAIGSLLFVRAYNRDNGLTWGEYLDAVLPVTGLCLACALPSIAWFALGGDIPNSRLPALLAATVAGAVFAIPYWLIGGRLGFLPERLTYSGLRQRMRPQGAASG
jgi:O-antigen/teichoic acid export membrane protein